MSFTHNHQRVHPAGEIVITADQAYSSGDPVSLGGTRAGVYNGLQDIASGDKMTVETWGIHQFVCGSAVTFAKWARLYWDTVAKTVLTAPTANTIFLGIAAEAKTSGQTVAKVILGDGIPVGFGVVQHIRKRFTVAEVNAGDTILYALPGVAYRIVDAAMIAIGGNAATATSVDITGVQSDSTVKLLAAAVAGLTQNTLLRAGATNAAILAAGASFVQNDVNDPILIGKTGSDLATATHIDVLLSYVMEAA